MLNPLHSGDNDQEEPTALKWALESKLISQNDFIPTLSAVFDSNRRGYVLKSPKRSNKRSSIQ